MPEREEVEINLKVTADTGDAERARRELEQLKQAQDNLTKQGAPPPTGNVTPPAAPTGPQLTPPGGVPPTGGGAPGIEEQFQKDIKTGFVRGGLSQKEANDAARVFIENLKQQGTYIDQIKEYELGLAAASAPPPKPPKPPTAATATPAGGAPEGEGAGAPPPAYRQSAALAAMLKAQAPQPGAPIQQGEEGTVAFPRTYEEEIREKAAIDKEYYRNRAQEKADSDKLGTDQSVSYEQRRRGERDYEQAFQAARRERRVTPWGPQGPEGPALMPKYEVQVPQILQSQMQAQEADLQKRFGPGMKAQKAEMEAIDKEYNANRIKDSQESERKQGELFRDRLKQQVTYQQAYAQAYKAGAVQPGAGPQAGVTGGFNPPLNYQALGAAPPVAAAAAPTASGLAGVVSSLAGVSPSLLGRVARVTAQGLGAIPGQPLGAVGGAPPPPPPPPPPGGGGPPTGGGAGGAAGGAGLFGTGVSGSGAVRFGAALAGLGIGLSPYYFAGRLVHDVLENLVEIENQAIQSTTNLTAAFGDSTQAMEQFAKASAQGQTGAGFFNVADVRNSLASLSQLQENLGMTNEQVQQLDQSAQKLSLIRDIPLQQATDALAQAMEGSAGAAEKLGLNLSDVSVAARYANGQFAAIYQTLTPIQKASAVAAVATQELDDQLKATKGTINPMEEATRQLSNAWTNFVADVGPDAFKGAADAIKILADQIKGFEDDLKRGHDQDMKDWEELKKEWDSLPDDFQKRIDEMEKAWKGFQDFIKNPAGGGGGTAPAPANLLPQNAPPLQRPITPGGWQGGQVGQAPTPGNVDFSPALNQTTTAVKEATTAVDQMRKAWALTIAQMVQAGPAIQGQAEQISGAVQNISELTDAQTQALSQRQAVLQFIKQQQLATQTATEAEYQQIPGIQQLTAAYQALNTAQQAANRAVLANNIAQSQLTALDLASQERRNNAAMDYSKLTVETLTNQGQMVDLQRQMAELDDQRTIAARTNLDLENQLIDARQAARPAQYAAEDINYQQQVIELKAESIRADMVRQTATQDEINQLPQLRQQYIALGLAKPGAELAATEAQRPQTLLQRQLDEEADARQKNLNIIDQANRDLQDQLIPLKEAQGWLDEAKTALDTMLELQDQAYTKEKQAATDASIAAQQAQNAANYAAQMAQIHIDDMTANLSGLQQAANMVNNLFTQWTGFEHGQTFLTGGLSGPPPTGPTTPGGPQPTTNNVTIQFNGPLSVTSQADIDAIAAQAAQMSLQALAKASQYTPNASPNTLAGAYTP